MILAASLATTLAKFALSVAFAAAVFLIAGLFAQHEFVTVLFPLVIIALAGFFTLRSNIAKIYREAYEAKEEQLKVIQEQERAAADALGHAQTEIATLKQQLIAESAKTNLQPLAERIDSQTETFSAQTQVLSDILTQIRSAPSPVEFLTKHEDAAADRFDKLTRLLELIAGRLGADPE